MLDDSQRLSAAHYEAARAVFDGAGVGVLFGGTASLRRPFANGNDPLASRVGLRCNLNRELLTLGPGGELREWLGWRELRAIIDRVVGCELDASAIGKLHSIGNYEPGYLRRSVKVAKLAKILARGPFRGEHMREAKLLVGDSDDGPAG